MQREAQYLAIRPPSIAIYMIRLHVSYAVCKNSGYFQFFQLGCKT